MITSTEALQALVEGNDRFVQDKLNPESFAREARRRELEDGQAPFAIILGCADSRAPAEIIFDQGLGDLFVVRVAGNIASPSVIGSIEFAASQFGTPLVVVKGHTDCGAVQATIAELREPGSCPSDNLASIVRRIRPAVEGLREKGHDGAELLGLSVRENVRRTVTALRSTGPILDTLVSQGKLRIVGAEYSLETGRVAFFDDA